jgi:3-phosphoinositide dependent protein kinase-1
MVQTLAYLQTCEVMHRDLKPQNLLLDSNFNIKFVDFGDAKKESEPPIEEEVPEEEEYEAGFQSDLVGMAGEGERRGTFVGTVNYLAPEMIKDSESTMASDLWALGCIIFKMVTGKVPFPGMSPAQVYPKILNREIDWPEKIEVDSDCKDLIDKLL